MGQLWKPGRSIRPHEPLYDMDPYRKEERGAYAFWGYAAWIVGALCVTGYALYRLLN